MSVTINDQRARALLASLSEVLERRRSTLESMQLDAWERLLSHDESPTLSPALASEIGLDELIALQQIDREFAEADRDVSGLRVGEQSIFFSDDDACVSDCFNHAALTYEQWQHRRFPFWSLSKIKQIFRELQEREFITLETRFDLLVSCSVNYWKLIPIAERVIGSPVDVIAENLKRNYDGVVYLIHALETPRYKIGHSSQLDIRAKTIEKQSPYPIEIVAFIKAERAKQLETKLHEACAPWRVHGEWFELPSHAVLSIKSLEVK